MPSNSLNASDASLSEANSISASDPMNPEIEIIDNSKKNRVFRLDPAFPVTVISMLVNFGLTNMILYGFTAKPRLAYLCATFSLPITAAFCMRDAQLDFENWEKSRRLRERNFPSHVMPYKVRYDWTDYEDVILAARERKLQREREANEREFEKERQ